MKTRTISVIISDETYKTLKNVSEMDKRSLSNWAVIAIEKELARRKSDRKGQLK